MENLVGLGDLANKNCNVLIDGVVLIYVVLQCKLKNINDRPRMSTTGYGGSEISGRKVHLRAQDVTRNKMSVL